MPKPKNSKKANPKNPENKSKNPNMINNIIYTKGTIKKINNNIIIWMIIIIIKYMEDQWVKYPLIRIKRKKYKIITIFYLLIKVNYILN